MSHLAIRVPDFSSVDPWHSYLQSHVHVLLTIPAFDPCQKFWQVLIVRRDVKILNVNWCWKEYVQSAVATSLFYTDGVVFLTQMLWVVWVQSLGCVSPRVPLTR